MLDSAEVRSPVDPPGLRGPSSRFQGIDPKTANMPQVHSFTRGLKLLGLRPKQITLEDYPRTGHSS